MTQAGFRSSHFFECAAESFSLFPLSDRLKVRFSAASSEGMELLRKASAFPGHGTAQPTEAIRRSTKSEIGVTKSLRELTASGNPFTSEVQDGKPLREQDADRLRIDSRTERDLSIGIVVPVLNESKTLEYFLSRLYEVSRGRYPVAVVDGGSSDDSVRIARQFFHTESIPTPNRGMQLNHGARCLLTDVLLFLHADSELPRGFDLHIRRALTDSAVAGGCFRLEFDASNSLLRFYSWFTQFAGRFFHYGDQGFFIRRDAFEEMGGFSALPFLEDVDFLRRLKRFGRFVVLPSSVRTSARRFMKRGIVRQQLANILLVTLFELGFSAGQLAKFYRHVR